MPVRVYDIAKKLGLEAREVLAKAKELGINAKVPSSSLDSITAEYLEEQLAPLARPVSLPAPPPVLPQAHVGVPEKFSTSVAAQENRLTSEVRSVEVKGEADRSATQMLREGMRRIATFTKCSDNLRGLFETLLPKFEKAWERGEICRLSPRILLLQIISPENFDRRAHPTEDLSLGLSVAADMGLARFQDEFERALHLSLMDQRTYDPVSICTLEMEQLLEEAHRFALSVSKDGVLATRHIVAVLLAGVKEIRQGGELEFSPGLYGRLVDAFRHHIYKSRKVASADVKDGWNVVIDNLEHGKPTTGDEGRAMASLAFDPATTVSNHLPAIVGDGVDGASYIDIRADVDSIARVICMKQVSPPLSIALFGNWGSGKSFFMRQVRNQVEKTRLDAAREASSTPFYSEIVQIDFNAWHYAEANLWASLASHIFEHLKTPGNSDAARNQEEQEALLEQLGVAQKQKEAAREELSRAKQEEAEAQIKLAEKEAERLQKLQTLEHIKTRDILKEVFAENDDDLVRELSEVRRVFGIDGEIETLEDASRALAEAQKVATDTEKFARTFVTAPGLWRRWLFVTLSISVPLVVPTVGTVVISIHNWPEWCDGVKWITTAVGTMGFLTIPLRETTKNFRAVLGKIQAADKRFAKLVNSKTKSHDEEVAQARVGAEEASKAVAQAKIRVKQAEKAVSLAEEALAKTSPRGLLTAFIEERAASGDYREKLGMLALVRRDFEKLSALMKRVREEPVLHVERHLPRIDRIILYIDDLDRCPPNKVVELLQAIHLLLAFELFVVIVGVDPRWVSHSLRTQYPALLQDDVFTGDQGNRLMKRESTREEHVSPEMSGNRARPLDYLEKIFQIPFWVRPISAPAVGNLIDGVLRQGKVTPQELVPSQQNDDRPATKIVSEKLSPNDKEFSSFEAQSKALAKRAMSDESVSPPLQFADVTLSSDEIDFLKSISGLAGSTPRAVKRYINIYRLLRIRVPKDQLSQFLGEVGRPREYEAVMLLVGLYNVDAQLARALASRLENREAPPALHAVLQGFLNANKLTSSQTAYFAVFQGYCERFIESDTLVTTEPFVRWNPVVARFSFCGELTA